MNFQTTFPRDFSSPTIILLKSTEKCDCGTPYLKLLIASIYLNLKTAKESIHFLYMVNMTMYDYCPLSFPHFLFISFLLFLLASPSPTLYHIASVELCISCLLEHIGHLHLKFSCLIFSFIKLCEGYQSF